MSHSDRRPEAVLPGLRARKRSEVAYALNVAEDSRPAAQAWTQELVARLRHEGAFEDAHRIGITGPPGVGKSTLVGALVRNLRARTPPVSVGILAVDPSSARSGGALLGDRVRIALDPDDEGVFLRSLATGGEVGGLARSVPVSALLLSAAFDVVLVETVGIGQTETDVRDVVDTVVLVLQPGSGDALQYMKAGIMEVPDLILVNKADQAELARRTEGEVRSALASLRGAGIGDAQTPVLMASARDGSGVDALVQALSDRRTDAARTGELARRRRAGTIAWALRSFTRRHGEAGVARRGGEKGLVTAIAARLDAGEDILGIVDALAKTPSSPPPRL